MKKWMFLGIALLLAGKQVWAQDQIMPASQQPLQIAIIAPLYLDSVFENGVLKNEKSLPGFIKTGIEFVNGSQIAFDTLAANKKIEVTIFDSKSKLRSVPSLIQAGVLEKFNLIIGSIRPPEFALLSDFSRAKKIPLISATYPNDDGIVNNPYLVIVNSTLRAHIEAIYSLLLQKHSNDHIYLVKQKGDDRIDNYFKTLNTAEGKPLLNINRIALDSFTTYQMQRLIDTSKRAVVIGAGLQENFAMSLATALYPMQKTNSIVFFGMPNWINFDGLRKNDMADFPIRFTSPGYTSPENPYMRFLKNRYFDLYRGKPSETAQLGFETTWFFSNLLLQYGQGFLEHLPSLPANPYFDFNFTEVNKSENDSIADYYENKHLYFLKMNNGKIYRD